MPKRTIIVALAVVVAFEIIANRNILGIGALLGRRG